MKCRLSYTILTLLTALTCSCKKPYNPTTVTTNYNYLVVEGLININDSTFINLSRTVTIGSAATTKPELKAVISIESNTGNSYPLKEKGNGMYAAPNYNLNPANQYRVRIRTADVNTYVSDFNDTKVTPPIDSLIRQYKSDGMYVSLNTHDPNNNTRYYRWDFEETWQFTSFFKSKLTAQGADTAKAALSPLFTGSGIAVLPRKDDIYHCWGDNYSHLITLNSSAALSKDVIQNQSITFVPSSSEKLSIRYRINVKQYALTKDAYDFWTLLKKNTEQLGSIFDAQPTASIGNIHNVNKPNEAVIGYISTCSVSQKLFYVNNFDVPKSYVADYTNNNPYNANTCQLTQPTNPVKCQIGFAVFEPCDGDYEQYSYFIKSYPHSLLLPIDVLVPFNPLTLTGSVTGSNSICVDCTERGNNVKPAFWQ